MDTSIVLNITITKPLQILQDAVEEVIVNCVDASYFKHFICSKEYGIYAIEINENIISSNIGKMSMIIYTTSKMGNSVSLLRVIVIYKLIRNTIGHRLMNAFYGKQFLKKVTLRHLLNFKKRVEKWM